MILAAVTLAVVSAVSFPVTTAVPSAQVSMDRGLFFYYAYDGGDALAAFAAAAQADPSLAMASWGEALAAGPDLNTPISPERFAAAQTYARAAATLAARAAPDERAFADAMAQRYHGTYADWAADNAAYIAAMAAIAEGPPGPHATAAKLLLAEALLERGGLAWDGAQPADPDARRALEIVTAVRAHDPSDPMANHLCVHAYDETPQRAPARACATALDAMALPPQGEHLAHMPAHYWIEVGDYRKALASSARAFALFAQLRAQSARDPDHDRYLHHDTYVGFSAAMMLGRLDSANTWAGRMPPNPAVPYEALAALRFGQFARARGAASDAPAGMAVRGYAALESGDVATARDLAHRLRGLPAPGDIADLFLARLAEADGHRQDAENWIGRAADVQRSLLGGELIPLLPALEARGGLALRARRYDDAVAAYRAALEALPNDPRALYGLATALSALGNEAEAASARARFADLWEGAPAPFLL